MAHTRAKNHATVLSPVHSIGVVVTFGTWIERAKTAGGFHRSGDRRTILHGVGAEMGSGRRQILLAQAFYIHKQRQDGPHKRQRRGGVRVDTNSVGFRESRPEAPGCEDTLLLALSSSTRSVVGRNQGVTVENTSSYYCLDEQPFMLCKM